MNENETKIPDSIYRKSARWLITQLIMGILMLLPAQYISESYWVIFWYPLWFLGLIIIFRSIIKYSRNKIILEQNSVKFLSGALFRKETDIPYARINSVTLSELFGVLHVSTSDNSIKESYAGMQHANNLRDELNERIRLTGKQSNINPANDVDTLERLAHLRDTGALTNEEFDLEKQKLLKS